MSLPFLRMLVIATTPLFLSACILPFTGVAVSVTQFANLVRDQYPDVDFEKETPIETTYAESVESVWNHLIQTLGEMEQEVAAADKASGVIRTSPKNLNDVSWIGQGFGEATFRYTYTVAVRQNVSAP